MPMKPSSSKAACSWKTKPMPANGASATAPSGKRQAKLNALRRMKRRNRVIKLSLFWTGAIALGAFSVIWNADAIVAALSHTLRMV